MCETGFQSDTPSALKRTHLQDICLDFRSHENRFREQFARFLEKHREQLQLPPGEDPASAYLERVWPDGLPGSMIVANTSSRRKAQWLIRPLVDGPAASSFAAGDLAPAFRVCSEQERLAVVGFEVVPHVAPRAMEAQVSGTIHINPAEARMSSADLAALEGLPSGLKEAEPHLAEWRGFLDWLEKLARIRQVALPYERFETADDGMIRFQVRGKWELKSLRTRLGGATLLAAATSASQYPERWLPDARQRPQLVRLGEVADVMPAGVDTTATGEKADHHHPGSPEDGQGPVPVIVTVSPDGGVARDPSLLPPAGFILSNIGGDLVPIVNGRRAIDRFLDGQGHHPYLGGCLFNIRNAGWSYRELASPGFASLNPEQLEAYRKGLSAADIFAVQGPPGTGKTHLIGEICRSVVADGGRVLVVSQTNLAVDNVLSGLAEDLAMRPLRVAQSDRVDPESQRFLEDNAVGTWLEGVRRACQRRHQERDALFGAMRAAEQGLRVLHQVLQKADELAAAITALQAQVDDLQARGAGCQRDAQQSQDQAQTLERRRQVLTELAAWLAAPEGDPPVVELLGDTPVGAQLSRVVDDLRRTVTGGQWALSWLPDSSCSSPSASVAIVQLARQACITAAELESPIVEMLALCKNASGVAVSADARRLRELEAERSRLAESDDEEDVRGIVAINREMRTLRQDRWGELSRLMTRLLRMVFQGDLHPDLDALTSALQPEAAHAVTLDALRVFITKLREGVQEVLGRNTGALTELAGGVSDKLRAEAEGHRQTASDRQQLMDEIDRHIEQTQDQMQETESRLRECQERWAEVWPEVCVDVDGGAVPAISVDALQAREQAFAEWSQRQAGDHERQRRMQPILDEWTHRLADPQEAGQPTLTLQYARHANVVGVTCCEAGQRDFYDRPDFEPFDLVIIDECSKATLPELLMAMLLGRKVILIGDHRQLPPMFRENESSFEEAIAEGLIDPRDFERYKGLVTAGLFQRLFEAAPDGLRHSLWADYRAHSQIRAANNQCYDGRLVAGPGEEELDRRRQHHLRVRDSRGGQLIEPHQHLLWVDSTWDARGQLFFEGQRGSSKVNLLEADLIATMLLRLNRGLEDRGYGPAREATAEGADEGKPLRTWVERLLGSVPRGTVEDLFAKEQVRLNGRTGHPDDLVCAGDRVLLDARKAVGVITFYGAQVGEIQRRIARIQRENAGAFSALNLRCNTVDRFQGMERPIVLVSLVRARRHLRGGEYVKEYRRVNVAMSRAQELLVIIGSERTFRDVEVDLPAVSGGPPRKVPLYRNIHDLVKRFGGRRYASQVLG